MTGGLKEQVTDGKDWFGFGIEPSLRAIIGSQQVPYIYEDRISKDDFISALKKVYYMSKTERNKMGKAGYNHFKKNYSMKSFSRKWYEVVTRVYKEKGSWGNRKNYKSWKLEEI